MATVLDVAKRAGVSPSTVSRALSDKAIVAPVTKERVMHAVRELGYEPNSFAQGLRGGKSNTVALAIGDIEQYVYLQLSQYIQTALESVGLNLLLFNLGHRDDRLETILNRAKALKLGGVFLATSDPIDVAAIERFRSEVEFSACPVVAIGQDATANGVPSVWHDDDKGAYTATMYLLEHGCRKIGYVGRITGSVVGSLRYHGYRRALQDWGLAIPENRIFDCAFRYQAGFASGLKIAANHADFDAVVCGSDEMALGVIAATSDAGIRVPDDLSVVGFNDIEWSSFVRPSLTTLSTNYQLLATKAAEIVTAAGKSSGLALKNKIDRELVIRSSTI